MTLKLYGLNLTKTSTGPPCAKVFLLESRDNLTLLHGLLLNTPRLDKSSLFLTLVLLSLLFLKVSLDPLLLNQSTNSELPSIKSKMDSLLSNAWKDLSSRLFRLCLTRCGTIWTLMITFLTLLKTKMELYVLQLSLPTSKISSYLVTLS